MLDVPPGSWARDGHMSAPMPALAASAYVDAFNAGFEDGFARWGVLGTVRAAVIGGWLYSSFEALGDADEVARRIERRVALPDLDEHEAVARRWLDDVAALDEERCRRLGAGLGDLDDAGLAARAAEVGTATRSLVRRRFADTAVYELVAEYVLRAGEVSDWDPATALAVLARSTRGATATTGTAARVGAVAAAVGAVPELGARLRDPADPVPLSALRAVPSVAAALDDLVAHDGDLLVEADLGSPTLAERPDVVVALVAAHLGSDRSPAATPMPQLDARLAGDAARAAVGHEWRERTANLLLRHLGLLRRSALELGRRLAAGGRLDKAEHVLDLTIDELASSWSEDRGRIAAGRAAARAAAAVEPPPLLLGDVPQRPRQHSLPEPVGRAMARIGWYASTLFSPPGPPEPPRDDAIVHGIGAAPGRVEGIARVVHGIDELVAVGPGDILVCATTTPAWTAALAVAGGVVCDDGGLTSHPALIARELGIPAVVGTKRATETVPDGVLIAVDGTAGTVRRMGEAT